MMPFLPSRNGTLQRIAEHSAIVVNLLAGSLVGAWGGINMLLIVRPP